MKDRHYYNNFSRIKVKRKNNTESLIHTSKSFLLPVLLTLVLVAVLAFVFALILLWAFKLNGNVSEQDFPPLLTLIVGVLESVVGLVSVWFVIRQLKSETETEEKENVVNVAEFIFKYNQEFIDSPKLSQIESYLESTLVTNTIPAIHSLTQTSEIRQQLVNYLVYLEGFASCIQEKVMEIKSVDNLFAYRFFLATNHPEVQKLELIPYSSYYKGVFGLYREWIQYRIFRSSCWKNEHNLTIADFCSKIWETRKTSVISYNTGLDLQDEYEDIVQTIVEKNTSKNSNLIEAFSASTGTELGYLEIKKPGKDILIALNTQISDDEYICFEALLFLLKQFSKNSDLTLEQIDNLQLCGDQITYGNKKEVLSGEKIANTVREMLKAIVIKPDNNTVLYKQLSSIDSLTKQQKEDIAGLIYDTDPYIYPAMFNSREDAIAILSELIENDPLYNKERFYVAQSGESIVGVLLWVDGSVYWSPKTLKNVAMKKRISLPDTLSKAVDEYFSERYDKPCNQDFISILNLCVNKNHRGLHIGNQLLSLFCKSHSLKKLKLCVLCDNTAAVQLYTKAGFVAEAIYDGFSVNSSKPKCMEMIKRIDI